MSDPSPTRQAEFEAAVALFHAACELEGAERAAFLARECAEDEPLRREVEALLAADSAGDTPLGALPTPGSLSLHRAAAEVPRSVGDYRIVGLLGAGGMGVVYEAEQADPRRRVALKLIRAEFLTADHLRRFQNEAQVLGWLNHPGIAQVYEAGTAETSTGPQPFFAMELVDGRPLNRYVEEERPGTEARVRLLVGICDAVHHAHQKGVIHRDLKPGNILVDRGGQPKVLDFGIARVTDADLALTSRRTGVGELVGTVAYMSPEQVRADPSLLDTRSDVYALGVLAYEVLSGKHPFDLQAVALHEAARVIVEDEPTSLGWVDRRLRGDLETIVHKAISKEKERRYASAEELAADLRRFLADEPITARPATRVYQLRKFTRRNRGLVTSGALLLVALVAGTATSTGLYFEMEGQRDAAVEAKDLAGERLLELQEARSAEAVQLERARREALAAQRMTSFLEEIFVVPDPESSRGKTITARAILDAGAAEIDAALADEPEVHARLTALMGRVYLRLGLYDESRPLLVKAIAELRRLGDEHRAELATALVHLGEVHHYREELVATQPLYSEALALRRKVLGEESADTAQSLDLMGRLLRDRGDLSGARRDLEEGLRIRARLFGDESIPVAESLQSLGMLDYEERRTEEATRDFEAALAVYAALGEEDHPNVPELWHALGVVAISRNDYDVAEDYLVASLESLDRIYGPDSRFRAHGLLSLSRIARGRGRIEDAEGLCLEALDLLDASDGLRPVVLNDYALAREDLGDRDAAQAILQEAIEAYEARMGRDHNYVAIAMCNLGMLFRARRDYPQAERWLHEAIDIQERLFPDGHVNLARSIHDLGLVQLDAGDPAGAGETFERVLPMYEKLYGPEHAETRMVLGTLLSAAVAQGDEERAAELRARLATR